MTTAKLTGIGSLPHHNADSALEYSFKLTIPFLPQIPIRNPWEYMIAQALEGLPGLSLDSEGQVSLSLSIWESRASDFKQKLDKALSEDCYDDFEPSSAVSSCWQPFVWELEERKTPVAKIQIAGPMTSQWALRLKDGTSADHHPELSSQIYRLVLMRAIAMTRRLKSIGVAPIVFLDEPGLFGINPSQPKHMLALQELKILIQTLRKEGAEVGLHCCSDTNWKAVLSLGLQYLSIDTALSLPHLLENKAELESYLASGGKLSLGAIPTVRHNVLQSLDADLILASLEKTLLTALPKETVRKILSTSILTPACGLAFHTVSDAERVLDLLSELGEACGS
jgi:hypothetical protein